MKKLIVSIIFAFIATYTVKADLGSCVVYYAKFYLKDGTSFKGCFEVASYFAVLNEKGPSPYCSDEGILELIKKLQNEGYTSWKEDGGIQDEESFHKIPVYKNLHYLKAKRLFNKETESSVYGFVDTSDVVLLDSADIEKTIFWDAQYSAREWLTSELVIASKGMIDTFQNQRCWNSIVVNLDGSSEDSLAFSEYDSMWGYRLINYNSKNNIEELKRLSRLKFHLRMDDEFRQKFRKAQGVNEDESPTKKVLKLENEAFQKHMQELRFWFWKRGIVMIRINGTC